MTRMHKSIRMSVAALLLVVPAMAAIAAEKDDPAKFKYRDLPIEASCLEGYHPTVDKDGNKVFPCIANAEIAVVPVAGGPVKTAPVVPK